ncbi:MAG: hypothetical protein IKP68_11235 [Clostridia bacterium]|nr:hypothetical protein [Clostridia bacterium]
MDNDMSLIRSELSYDEMLLWSGKSKRGLHLSGQRIYLLLFGVFFLGFAVFWTAGAMQSGTFMWIFGIPFIAVGIYTVFGRALTQSGAVYGITDRRIIIKTKRSTESVPFSSVRSVSKRDFPDGSGDITFVTGEMVSTRYGYGQTHRTMYSVPDAARAYMIINERMNG